MLHSLVDSLAGILYDTTLKATVLLLAAWLTTLLLRRSSSALKHRLWSLSMLGLLLLPVLSWALPAWQLAVLPVSEQNESTRTPAAVEFAADVPERDNRVDAIVAAPPATDDQNVPTIAAGERTKEPVASSSFTMTGAIGTVGLWSLGCVLSLTVVFIGWCRARRMVRSSSIVQDAQWQALLTSLCQRLGLRKNIELREGTDSIVPLTWGLFKPVVLIPSPAHEWSDSLKQSVLLHELLHIQRGDIAYQLIARLACAVYWFHPLAWLALNRLRHEREQACDDAVINTGERASDYAGHLLEVARRYHLPRGLSLAIEMARPGRLERRLRALFDERRDHTILSRGRAMTLLAASAFIISIIAVMQPVPATSKAIAAAEDTTSDSSPPPMPSANHAPTVNAEKGETIQGTVISQESKPVAGIEVRVFRADGRRLPSFMTDENGNFDVPAVWWDIPRFAGDSFVIVTGDEKQGIGWAMINTIRKRIKDGVIVPYSPSPFQMHLLPFDQTISGRVVNPDGNPIVGVRVQLTRLHHPENYIAAVHEFTPNEEPAFPAVKADDEGRFTLRIPPKTEVSIKLMHPDWVELLVQFKPDNRRNAGDITLIRGGYVAGKVTNNETGEGMAGIGVSASSRQDRREAQKALPAKPEGEGAPFVFLNTWSSTVTDEHGHYRMDGLVPGEHQLSVNHNPGEEHRQFVTARPDAIEVKAGETSERDVELQVGRHVTGRVQFAGSGEPLADVNVSVNVYSDPLRREVILFQGAHTNERGEFDCYVLPGYVKATVNLSDQDGRRHKGSTIDFEIAANRNPAPLEFQLEKPPADLIRPPLIKRFNVGGRISAIAFNADATQLVVAGSKEPIRRIDPNEKRDDRVPRGQLSIWSIAEGKELARFDDEFGAIADMALSPDGKAIATVGLSLDKEIPGEVKVWDVDSKTLRLTIQRYTARVRTVGWSPNGQWVASGSADHTTRIWDPKSGDQIAVLRDPSSPYSIQFSDDGKYLVTGHANGTVKFWATDSWQEFKSFEVADMFLWSIDLSPDGTRFAAAGNLKAKTIAESDVAYIMDAQTGVKQVAKLEKDFVADVAFSPSGKYLAGTSGDAFVWNVETGKEEAVIANRSFATSEDRIVYSPDGRAIAISRAFQVTVWDVNDFNQNRDR
ncbi:MAG: M56 family metallopeptidase [Planctomycetaceae bacterium]